MTAAVAPALKLVADYEFEPHELEEPDEAPAIEGNVFFSLSHNTALMSALSLTLGSVQDKKEELVLLPPPSPCRKFFLDIDIDDDGDDGAVVVKEEEKQQQQPQPDVIYISSEDEEEEEEKAAAPPSCPPSPAIASTTSDTPDAHSSSSSVHRAKVSSHLVKRHLTRSARFDPRRSSSASHHSTPRLDPIDEFWVEMSRFAVLHVPLADLVPPTPDDALPARARDPAPFYQDTDPVGRYLIKRGFPLIGTGSCTLTFLLTKELVAKVPLYCINTNRALYEQHRSDNNYIIELYQHWPTCVARTRLLFARLEPSLREEDDVAWSTSNTSVQEHPVFSPYHFSFYVQERLRSETISDQPLDLDKLKHDKNIYTLAQMHIHNPPGTQFKQWARSYPKTMSTYTSPGISEEFEDNEWLLLFDLK